MNFTSDKIINLWGFLDNGNWDSLQYYFLPRENRLVELDNISDKRNNIDYIDDVRRIYIISDATTASKKLDSIKNKVKKDLILWGLEGSVEKHLPTLVTDVVRVNVVCSLSRKSVPVNKENLIKYATSSQYVASHDLDDLIKKIKEHPSESFRLISQSTSHDVRAFIYKSDSTTKRIQVRKSGVLICPPKGKTPTDVIVQFPDKHRIRMKRSDAKTIQPEFVIGYTFVISVNT